MNLPLLILWCALVLVLHNRNVVSASIKITSCTTNKCLSCAGVPIKVIQKEGACRNKPVNYRKTITQPNNLPMVDPGVNKLGEYVLNISWKPARVEYELPKKYVLYFELSDGAFKIVDTKCIRLRVDWSMVNTSQSTPKLFYDCIKLNKGPKKFHISVQIFSLLKAGNICRSKRYIGATDEGCDAVCTQKQNFRLDEGFYHSKICAKSSRPNISSVLDDNKVIKVVTGKVPPFTKTVEVLVKNETGEDAIVFDRSYHNPETSILEVETNVSRNGIYRVICVRVDHRATLKMVHYRCEGSDDKGFSLKQKDPIVINEVIQSAFEMPVLVLVGSLVIMASVATCAIFCVQKLKQRPCTVKDLLPPEIRGGLVRCPHVMDSSRRKRVLMALYHQDNPHHEEAFKNVVNFLKEAGNVDVKYEDWSNLHDFADGAGETYMDILVFLSEGLYRAAHEYKQRHNSGSGEAHRLVSDCTNDISGTVMEVLRQRSRSSSHCKFVVHLISFGYQSVTGQKIEKLFMDDHYLFLNSSNTMFYEISSLSPGSQTASIKEKHLMALLKYACNVLQSDSVVENFVHSEKGMTFISNVTIAIRKHRFRPDQSETVLSSVQDQRYPPLEETSLLNNNENFQLTPTRLFDQMSLETEDTYNDCQALRDVILNDREGKG